MSAKSRVGNEDRRKKPPHRPTSVALERHGRRKNDEDENDEDDSFLVSCRCESAKAFATLLLCLKRIAVGSDAERESYAMTPRPGRSHTAHTQTQPQRYRRRTVGSTLQPVTVFCSPTGLTFHVYGKSKQMQASVDMPAALFSDYSVASDSDGHVGGEFCVNLTTVMECLYSLGTHNLEPTKLSCSYNLTSELWTMELLQDDGVLCTAAIPGLVAPDETVSLALAFRSSPVVARFIVQSEPLHELVAELDLVAGGTVAHVALTPTTGLSLTVVGYLGQCHVVLPVRGSHVVSVEFPAQLDSVTTARTFPLRALTESLRGLEMAHETCLTLNGDGMLAIQHQVLDPSHADATPSFIDFILCCLHDVDEDGTVTASQTLPWTQSSAAAAAAPTATASSPTTASVTTASARIVSQNKVYYDSDTAAAPDEPDRDTTLTDIYAHNGTTTAAAGDDATLATNTTAAMGLFASIVAADLQLGSSPNFLDAVSSRPAVAATRKRRFGRRSTDKGIAPARSTTVQGGESTRSNGSVHESDDEVLDITAPATPPRRRQRRKGTKKNGSRHENSPPSSPELVYGSQE